MVTSCDDAVTADQIAEAQRLAHEWDERTRVREPSVFLRKMASPRGIALM